MPQRRGSGDLAQAEQVSIESPKTILFAVGERRRNVLKAAQSHVPQRLVEVLGRAWAARSGALAEDACAAIPRRQQAADCETLRRKVADALVDLASNEQGRYFGAQRRA